MCKSDAFVISIWAAVVFGLGEGIILSVTRSYPQILAPFKASPHILWVAPLIDLPLFLVAALGFLFFSRLLQRWLKDKELLIIYGVFIFLGVFTLLETAKIIHPLAVFILSLGATVASCGKLRGGEQRLTEFLHRRLVWTPVLIIIAGTGVYVYQEVMGLWRLYQLPAF